MFQTRKLKMTSEAETKEESPERAVVGWRCETLVSAGYPIILAEILAASPADLHRAVELIESGCEPALAAEILL